MPDTSADHNLGARIKEVRQRIAHAATRIGRRPDDVMLVAVGKSQPVELLRLAIKDGVRHIGENRVQEAEAKIKIIGSGAVSWHLIGHLQTNKARRAVSLFDVVQSLDSEALASRLDKLCRDDGREKLPVLIQVNLAQEETKSGTTEDSLVSLAENIGQLPRLELIGLMTLPPYFDDAEHVRPFFRKLRELRDSLAARHLFAFGEGELSMGMSHDFEIAVEEGATIVRVGTAIFGERSRQVTGVAK